MMELVEQAFSGVNLLYTILLLMVLVYWLIVILGLIDLDAFDLDLDADVDGGLDAHEGGFSWLAYFNVGEAPIMFFVSIVALVMWVVSMQVNSWLDSAATSTLAANRGWLAVAIAPLNLAFALFVAKFLMLPARRLRGREARRPSLIGKTCLVTSLEVTDAKGRCELPKHDHSLILEARTRNGEVLHKGDPAEIVETIVDGDHEYFIVTRQGVVTDPAAGE